MAIYMKYGDIAGEVTAKGYEGRLECTSANFGTSRPSSVASGSGQGKRHTDACSVDDLDVSRNGDKATPLLFNQSCGGTEQPCWVEFVKTDTGNLVTWLKLVLKNCLITSFSVDGQDGAVSESMKINFTEIEVIYTSTDEGGKEASTKGKFNVATAVVG